MKEYKIVTSGTYFANESRKAVEDINSQIEELGPGWKIVDFKITFFENNNGTAFANYNAVVERKIPKNKNNNSDDAILTMNPDDIDYDKLGIKINYNAEYPWEVIGMTEDEFMCRKYGK